MIYGQIVFIEATYGVKEERDKQNTQDVFRPCLFWVTNKICRISLNCNWVISSSRRSRFISNSNSRTDRKPNLETAQQKNKESLWVSTLSLKR